MTDPIPIADPLDRVSDALLAYVREIKEGLIPRVQIDFVRSPTDLPGTTSEDEWEITLTVSAIEKLEDDATPVYGFRESFHDKGTSKEEAIFGVVKKARYFLEGAVIRHTRRLSAATSALKCLDEMPVLPAMWRTTDPPDPQDEHTEN